MRNPIKESTNDVKKTDGTIYVENALQGKIELFEVEKDYAEKHQLLSSDIEVLIKLFNSVPSNGATKRRKM